MPSIGLYRVQWDWSWKPRELFRCGLLGEFPEKGHWKGRVYRWRLKLGPILLSRWAAR